MDRDIKYIYENDRGQSIEFSIWSPFLLKKIDGIDGLKNTIYSSKGLNQDGATYISDTLDVRNIVIEGTISENKLNNRATLLKIFNPKVGGKLKYITPEGMKYINCRVEKGPTITDEIMPKYLISLISHNPFWKDDIQRLDVASWTGDFEFPLEIVNMGMELGHREPSLIANIENKGDVDTGMIIEFKALGALSNPSLFNVNTRELLKINKDMAAGDKIIVNTNYGKKKVLLESNGVITNIFNAIDDDSTFVQLYVGDNLFRYNADSNIDNLEVSIYYNNQFVGV